MRYLDKPCNNIVRLGCDWLRLVFINGILDLMDNCKHYGVGIRVGSRYKMFTYRQPIA